MTRTWAQRLVAAKKRGRFTLTDQYLARQPMRCALGEKCGGSFEEVTRVPTNVYQAAYCFTGAVSRQDVPAAWAAYREIHRLTEGR